MENRSEKGISHESSKGGDEDSLKKRFLEISKQGEKTRAKEVYNSWMFASEEKSVKLLEKEGRSEAEIIMARMRLLKEGIDLLASVEYKEEALQDIEDLLEYLYQLQVVDTLKSFWEEINRMYEYLEGLKSKIEG